MPPFLGVVPLRGAWGLALGSWPPLRVQPGATTQRQVLPLPSPVSRPLPVPLRSAADPSFCRRNDLPGAAMRCRVLPLVHDMALRSGTGLISVVVSGSTTVMVSHTGVK